MSWFVAQRDICPKDFNMIKSYTNIDFLLDQACYQIVKESKRTTEIQFDVKQQSLRSSFHGYLL